MDCCCSLRIAVSVRPSRSANIQCRRVLLFSTAYSCRLSLSACISAVKSVCNEFAIWLANLTEVDICLASGPRKVSIACSAGFADICCKVSNLLTQSSDNIRACITPIDFWRVSTYARMQLLDISSYLKVPMAATAGISDTKHACLGSLTKLAWLDVWNHGMHICIAHI